VPQCPDPGCQSGLGEDYQGHASSTVSGRVCQRWDAQTPHSHIFDDASRFPDDDLSDAANYCRNPDDTSGGLWCYTQDEDVRWELCAVPQCQVGCKNGLGANYMGLANSTVNGRTCQRWSEQTPQSHTYYKEDSEFPDVSVEAAENYCRNPLSDSGGPWCYTTDPDTRWEYCDIPDCPGVGCMVDNGVNYMGFASLTTGGLVCQRWDLQAPHSHSRGSTDEQFPDASLSLAENYCRNPDGEDSVWCYTIDSTRWDYCDVPQCPSAGCLVGRGLGYVGQQSHTTSGLQCQRWDSQTPHSHTYYVDADEFPDASVSEAENYCRNPSNDEPKLWCYTTNPEVRWGYCDVPVCNDGEGEDEENEEQAAAIVTDAPNTGDTGGCVNTMEEYQYMHAEGAKGVDGVSDVDACNALCLNADDCAAIDYDIRDNPWGGIHCWVHKGSAGHMVADDYTHHFVKVYCQE